MPAMIKAQGGLANDARRAVDAMSKDAKKKFMKSDRDKSGALDKVETQRLIKKMGYPVDSDFDEVFAQFDDDASNTITLDEFAGMYHLLEERKREAKLSKKKTKSKGKRAATTETKLMPEGLSAMEKVRWRRENPS